MAGSTSHTLEEVQSSASWDPAEQSDAGNSGTSGQYGRPALRSLDSPGGLSALQPNSSSPQPRSSTDSVPRSSTSRWRDSPTVASDPRETLASVPSETASLVDGGFDGNVLRALCDLDCGVPLLLDRIKQSVVSCRETSVFFKKRAAIEEEYGKNLQKLARTTSDVYSMNDGKAGSFVNTWQMSMRIHESMAENRIRFAQRLNEMSEELTTLVKEVDKSRKQTKDLATRYERALQESELATEKSKNRLDMTTEELERVLLQKEGESFKDTPVQARVSGPVGKRAIGKAVAKGGLLLKGKNPGNIQRQEDDIRARMSAASDTYRKLVTETQTLRQEYFNFQLPRLLRALKECTDEVDLGTQYHLTRYAFLFERGSVGVGLKAATEMIDNRNDFKTYMQNYAYAHGASSRGPRREGPADDGFLPPLPKHQERGQPPPSAAVNGVTDKGRPTFGIDLSEQMERDNVEVPSLVEKCCTVIEKYGMKSQGVYRLNGTTSKVYNLKQRLDKDLDSVDLDAPEWSSDINNVTSVLKMWLRELPDPLLTLQLHQGFIDAAKIENDRLRHIRLHERVNDLPDPNYATLKYFLGHLHRITQHADENLMTIQNLAIVFGPTLFGQVMPANGANGQMNGMGDTLYQNLARLLFRIILRLDLISRFIGR
ncbi:hypothetical protein PLEOSDRAFT_1113232 [Pleurotus ostreatus PC15]|uniref:GTPase activating protein n=1 Tax=Pleurotus ostreatus (strain PC15) TaxID=1137138 RepID=A0A067NRX7_PLEO1|nr:hypothetical protein PLEOSDRAFT_1113232 [Pleurotus ostreatus PC15]